MLLTTHYLDEAEHLADRVGVIAAGRLLDVAAVDRLGGPARRTPVVRWRRATRSDEERDRPTRPPRCCRWRPGWAAAVPELEVRRPSLEDVYLAMIAEARPARRSPSR